MFSLEDIKKVKRNYLVDDKGEIRLQLRAKDDSSITRPEQLKPEEKNYILSALFLNSILKLAPNYVSLDGKTDEQILQNAQADFLREALNSSSKTFNYDSLFRPTESLLIWESIAKNNALAIEYFKRTMGENGKDIKNLSAVYDEKTDERRISYELITKSRNLFVDGLKPNNSQYTQPQKKLDLTPEQLTHRKEIVERLISDYRKMEHTEWYESRTQKEETDMQRIANIINKNNIINSAVKGPGLFRILIAAQNLSLEGEQDFLEEMLKQPAVNDALLELKKSGYVHTIHTEAQENERNGRINSDGLLDGHSLTHGEKNIREANQFISEHPNAVSVARKKLSERNSFLVKYGDKETMRKARLVEVVARTQGKSITRTTDVNKNRILQVDDGKEQSK